MAKSISLVGLDVGEKRIGVAAGDNLVKIAYPVETVEVDGNEIDSIAKIYTRQKADILVVGYPRNQSGQPTAQTEFVERFVERLARVSNNIVYQDESLTSVMAEQQLNSHNKPYSKADIDARAAALILKDYIEMNYA